MIPTHLPVQVPMITTHLPVQVPVFPHNVGDGADLDGQREQTDRPLDQHDAGVRLVRAHEHELQQGRDDGDTGEETDGVDGRHHGQDGEDEHGQTERVQGLERQDLWAENTAVTVSGGSASLLVNSSDNISG